MAVALNFFSANKTQHKLVRIPLTMGLGKTTLDSGYHDRVNEGNPEYKKLEEEPTETYNFRSSQRPNSSFTTLLVRHKIAKLSCRHDEFLGGSFGKRGEETFR